MQYVKDQMYTTLNELIPIIDKLLNQLIEPVKNYIIKHRIQILLPTKSTTLMHISASIGAKGAAILSETASDTPLYEGQ